MQKVSNKKSRLMLCLGSFVCLAAVCSISVSGTTESVWETRKSNDHIHVLQREMENSDYLETKGTLRTKAGMFAIIGVLQATQECSSWLYKCRFAKNIEKFNAGKSVYYMVIDSPFLLKDRDMYVRSSMSYYPDEKKILIELTGAHDYAPPEKKRVRVLNLRGTWQVTELDDGEVQVTYQVHSNPQISPKGPVDSTMIKSVFVTLENLDRLAQLAPYRDTVFSKQQIQSITVLPQ